MGKWINLIGMYFGKLNPIEYLGGSNWKCICKCGNYSIVKTSDLTRGHTKSCGCNNRKYTIDETYFEDINTEQKAYMLGFIYADGYINEHTDQIKIDLKTIDEELLLKFCKDMEYDYVIKHYYQKSKFKNKIYDNDVSRFVITNRKMYNDLVKIGLYQNKSKTIGYPFGFISEDLVRHFVRGYFDGNGSISFSKDKIIKINLSLTGSDNIICDFIKIIENKFTGIKIYKYHRHIEALYNSTMIIANREYCINFLNWLYEGSTMYLNRKYNKFIELKSCVEAVTTNP